MVTVSRISNSAIDLLLCLGTQVEKSAPMPGCIRFCSFMYNHLSYLCILTCIGFVHSATVNVGSFYNGTRWDTNAGTREMQTQNYDTEYCIVKVPKVLSNIWSC